MPDQVGDPFENREHDSLCPHQEQPSSVRDNPLTEGVSIRATERLTGVNRGTIMRLGVQVGMGCARLHGAMMRNLHVNRIELDEAWSYVGKKQARVTPEDPADLGDQYVFVALAGAAKAIVAYRVGSGMVAPLARFSPICGAECSMHRRFRRTLSAHIRERWSTPSESIAASAPSRSTTRPILAGRRLGAIRQPK